MKSKRFAYLASPLWVLALPLLVFATQVTLPFTFAPNTVADANQVNQNFVQLRNGINNLHTTGGVILAGAHIVVGPVPTVTRSFTNLPGAPAITVQFQGVGNYVVDFGADVSGRYYSATIGQTTAGSAPNLIIEATNAGGNPNGVFIDTEDNAGAQADANFYIFVY